MPVMRSRLRAHAVEWHVAPAAHVDPVHRAVFLELQRRCNSQICRHAALLRNAWLDSIESGSIAFAKLLCTLQQLAIVLRQTALAREQHALQLTHGHTLIEGESGAAVVICFDENGVPWRPALPGMGLGDPYILSERLHSWWSLWQHSVPQAPPGWCLRQCEPVTRTLCDLIDAHYNAEDIGTALGTMLALENSMSTDIWQRLQRGLRQRCAENGIDLPDAGFFPVAETHARLQARHALYLVEAASVHDLLDAERLFNAGQHVLEQMDCFWKMQAEHLQSRH